jgi:hypothetical protein
MRNQKLFAVLTLLLTIGIVVTLVNESAVKPSTVRSASGSDETMVGTPASTDITPAVVTRVQNGYTALLTGINHVAPDRDTIPTLEEIPWARGKISRLFHSANQVSPCQLFPPGMQTMEQPATPRQGMAGPIGRLPVFSVALRIDPDARAALPDLSKDMIESYLDDHIITLQSSLYHNEQGAVYFGDQLGAAFSVRKSSSFTLKPEQMVADYVSEFKTLGLFSPPDFDGNIDDLRTLVLAFRYDSQEKRLTTSATSQVREYELIFLHLLKTENSFPPKVAVFVTSEGRTKFHELDMVSTQMLTNVPSIIATIRFDKFNLMGMYPANPIVTGIHHQSRLTLPSESVRSKMLGLGGQDQMLLSDLLDELHNDADASATVAASL